MEQTTMISPIYKIMGMQKVSNIPDFGDTTGTKNPLFNNINQVINQNNDNNNNFLNIEGMNNPMCNFINDDNYLDEQLDKLNEVILIFMDGINKIQSGIVMLNSLIANIRKNRRTNAKNNKDMMNNMEMIYNNINNNLINSNINNNMMNSDFLNNMTNSKININMMKNNNDNNIMNMMNNSVNTSLNPMMDTNKIEKMEVEEYNVIFRKDNAITRVKCKSNEKVSDIIERYRDRSCDEDKNLKFFFNSKELNENLTISEAGIRNNSNIFIVLPKKQ